MVRKKATFDSSFWVHACYVGLVDFLLRDFQLICTQGVEHEFRQANPTSQKLKDLLKQEKIKRGKPESVFVRLYGEGERDAINLALERKTVLLMDDWKPFQAAQSLGVSCVNSVVYLLSLCERELLPIDETVAALLRLSRRGTIRPAWIEPGLKVAQALSKNL